MTNHGEKPSPKRASEASRFQPGYGPPPFEKHQIYAEMSEALARISKEINQMDSTLALPVPRHLYHYTKRAALIAILDSKKLRLTNYRRMAADEREVIYGLDSWAEVLKQKLRNLALSKSSHAFLRLCLNIDGPYTQWNDGCIACFCADGYSTTHFKRFGEAAIDFSLVGGIQRSSAGHLPQVLKLPKSCSLRKIIYDSKKQTEQLEAIIEPFINFLENYHSKFEDAGDRSQLVSCCVEPVFRKLIAILPFFKDSTFEDEHEWRLLMITHGKEPSAVLEKSFEEIELQEVETGLMPIDTVVLSPELARLETSEIREAVEARGYVVRVSAM